ncbi:sensor histidine kinase [Granulosicoccus antarcticus]|uniref:histidine kinase n=1 Tax=Granulosicoccus antarcticus IMCC3135 TaxID=1192854 RepID=A0A2Z2NSW9_9GAMM|nr:sensor histidine kinase [Granulosicoccus antarcticus]ASJ73121.1 Sensor histidine kinase ResE [Granulosicoccus antarcticus IMCC3135]
MLSGGVILGASLGYLGLLFLIAHLGERAAAANRSLIANPYVYTLSMAVYCTAWTYYGSVGRAASTGIGFLPIYLGPTLMAATWWFVLRKIIRISRQQRLNSIADFIASRYGKSALLGGLVTVVAVVGILPYISLQLKAVSTSYAVLRDYPELGNAAAHASPWQDTALWIALAMAAFTILFGARNVDATERHEGMVAAVAFESLFKLVAFLAVGLWVTFGLYDGPGELFRQASTDPRLLSLVTTQSLPGGYTSWLSLTLLSMVAIMFLPRQFHMAVVENVDENHVRRAMWLFPLYLLVINLFVLPLGFAGEMRFAAGSVDPDTYVLTLPLAEQHAKLALFVFLGGLSAATGMVIVATIALTTMVSNELVMPILLRTRGRLFTTRLDAGRTLIRIRRVTIIVLMLLAYLHFYLVGESYSLVTIGLVSFCAVAQFTPAVLFGLYWKAASRIGAIAGLVAGFVIWLYTLLLPEFAQAGWLPSDLLDEGPMGIALLRPFALFGLQGLDPISHSLFWSLLANTGLFVTLSLFGTRSVNERVQAARFVDVFNDGGRALDVDSLPGHASVADLEALLSRFLGPVRTSQAFAEVLGATQTHSSVDNNERRQAIAAPVLVERCERLLAGAIGAASARVMIDSITGGTAPSIESVLSILEESSKVRSHSRRLERQSRQLEKATDELRSANERLQELDRLKDEFVATVSHELRSPLTSIRAFSEILLTNPEMETAQREEFLGIVVKESERLTRLVDQVLDLAKIESGRMEWRHEVCDLRRLVTDSLATVSQLFRERDIELVQTLPDEAISLNVDSDRIIQLLVNLLSNSVKFCDPTAGRVQLRLSSTDDGYRIEVEDNGAGIAADDVEHVFEKFHQASRANAGESLGTGLGLPISRHIAEHHGGHLHVAHTGPGSTVFAFDLPADTATGHEPDSRTEH